MAEKGKNKKEKFIEATTLTHIPIEKVPGIGPKIGEHLRENGIKYAGQLYRVDKYVGRSRAEKEVRAAGANELHIDGIFRNFDERNARQEKVEALTDYLSKCDIGK